MKKTFPLTSEKKAQRQHVDWIKYQIKRYVQRECRKALPEGAHGWAFNCKIGKNESEKAHIRFNEVRGKIDEFVEAGCESFYIEILVKPK